MRGLLCILCAVAAVAVLCAAQIVPVSTAPSVGVTAPTSPTVYRVIGIWDGRVAVFRPQTDTPECVYDTAWQSLPVSEQQRLREGIEVRNDKEMRQTLEDYLS